LISKKLRAIDLFSGAGGLQIGFNNAGYEIIFSSDIDKDCEITHNYNYPDIPFICDDIKNFDKDTIKGLTNNVDIDIVIGGPPCQGFSTIGKRVSSSKEKRESLDPRNYLFKDYIKVIEYIDPKVVLLENVHGMLTLVDKNKKLFIDNITDSFKSIGYKNIDYKLLDCVDYGVPQHRKRVFILCNKLGKKNTFPIPTHAKNIDLFQQIEPYTNVGESIMDLLDKYEEFDNHIPMKHGEKNVKRYSYIPEGGRLPEDKLPKDIFRKNFGNTFKRLDRKKPALTMVPGHSAFPIHPTLNRSLTVREAARLQTFPDHIKFFGNRTSQGKQVGNAVPVLMAEKIAEHLKNEF